MSFFEDAFITARELGSSVSKKTGQLVDVTKLRVKAAEIESEIDKRCRSLGRAVYEARKSGADIEAMVEESISGIDVLNDRLEEIRSRISALRNKVSCSSCGADMDKQALYCSRCGARLDAASRSAQKSETEPEE